MKTKKYFFAILFIIIGIFSIYFIWKEWKSVSFDEEIKKYSKKYKVPASLIKAVIKRESDFNPKAVGRKKEYGLMQITSGVITDWNQRKKHEKINSMNELFNSKTNIMVGTWYLSLAYKKWNKYKERVVLSLAQYNAGPGAVKKWTPKNKNDSVLENITYPTTKKYIKYILYQQKKYLELDKN